MRNEKQTRSHRLWIGRAFMLALCFAGTYVLLQWDADASLALVAFIMPLFGFLAGILVALLRKKLDWWYCVAMGLGFLLMSFLDGSFGLVSILLSDLLTGAIVGVIICLLAKAMPKKKRHTSK